MGYYKKLAATGRRNSIGTDVAGGNVIEVDKAEFDAAIRYIESMRKSLDEKWLKATMRRNSNPIVEDMRQRSHSVRLMDMIGITTAKRRAGNGVRIGVIKNDPQKFPKFSAQGLAAVLEYGTQERFRKLKALGLITGRQSTGSITAKPFLRPAWRMGINGMINKTVKAIEKKVP